VIRTLSLDEGTSTFSCSARLALRMRVSRSAIGSLIIAGAPYQLALITPGTSPLRASSRKQIRHVWNLRRKPAGRPHAFHRLYARDLNLGAACCFMMSEVFAIL